MTHHSKSDIAESIMHYILKLEYYEIMLIIAIINLFFQYFSNVFCKGSWSAYNNITYTEI